MIHRCFVLALVLGATVPRFAWARGHAGHDRDDQSEDSADDDGDDTADARDDDAGDDQADDDQDDQDDRDDAADDQRDDDGDRADAKKSAPEEPPPNRLAEKQDLTGHDLGKHKKPNAFENDRFFVDKVDTRKTRKATLIQGSVTSTSFVYTEHGGNYVTTDVATGKPVAGQGSDASRFSRLFTDLRLQTDFRHIKASRWDARIDARLRVVSNPPDTPFTLQGENTASATTATHIQSGLTGQNEYDLRELWVVRNGRRSDVFLGRQYIPDLGGVKIDGIRLDYAKSNKLTLLGFAGLYPLRGSRSLSTDYLQLKKADGKSAGRFVGAGGFGGAYRIPNAYGAIGVVILEPLAGEPPRVFATSNGYWRYGSKLDLYHYAIVDLLGRNDALGVGHAGLTNLSVGANFKPSQRLRLTASYNRVDTATLDVQAYAFLSQPQGMSVVQNEVSIARLSTNELRGSISAGLGHLERFQITVASAFRYRPSFTVAPPGATDPTMTATLPEAKSVEIYGSVVDRHSFKDTRIGADIVKTFGVGTIAFQRSELVAVRAFAKREIKNGQGEWDAEVGYSKVKDSSTGAQCSQTLTDLPTCFGTSSGSLLSLGGTLYYRFNRNWFGLASAYVTHSSLEHTVMSGMMMTTASDPAILGLSGFVQLAYRF